MRMRPRRRNLVVWSSAAPVAPVAPAVSAVSAVSAAPAAPAARARGLARPRGARPSRASRIRWWLRIGALLVVIGILRLGRTTRARRELLSLLAGALLTVTGLMLSVAGTFLLGLLVLIVTLLKGIRQQGRHPAR
jgi:hypothetical protein